MVCPDDYEPKEPQLFPLRFKGDAIALRDPRPDRTEPVTVYVGTPGFSAFQSIGSADNTNNMQPDTPNNPLFIQSQISPVTVVIS